MTALTVAPCSRKAAEHAVLRWHYSQTMPVGKLVTLGVWEHERYTGAVAFGRGAQPQLGAQFGLAQTELCELVRVALRDHKHHVSQIVAAALRQLRTTNPGLRAVVSFADPAHGHHGGIYQAGNWLYMGHSETQTEYLVNGERVHERTLSSLLKARAHTRRDGESRLDWLRRTRDPRAQRVTVPSKHRYVYPLDRAMRRRLTKHAKPYPHAGEVSTAR